MLKQSFSPLRYPFCFQLKTKLLSIAAFFAPSTKQIVLRAASLATKRKILFSATKLFPSSSQLLPFCFQLQKSIALSHHSFLCPAQNNYFWEPNLWLLTAKCCPLSESCFFPAAAFSSESPSPECKETNEPKAPSNRARNSNRGACRNRSAVPRLWETLSKAVLEGLHSSFATLLEPPHPDASA